MNEKREKYLPLGTVVRLKNGEKNLMINGFSCTSPDTPNEIMDYNGCLYPEGMVSPDLHFLFNHDQIEEILFMGFENEEEKIFKKRLNEYLTYGTIDGIKPKSNEDFMKPKMINDNVETPKIIETLINDNSNYETEGNSDIFNI